MSPTANILVADDHEFFRKGLILALQEIPYIKVIGEASNGLECLKMLAIKPVDIILMDLKMPVMNGIEATQIALLTYPNLKIIFLTSYGEEETVDRMVEAGALGILLKNTGTHGLELALKTVIKGQTHFTPELMGIIAGRRKVHEKVKRITKRERQILQLVAKGLTNQQIAGKLYVSQRTITNHRANMHKKTRVHNTIQLLSWAIKNNLIENLNN